jgi:acyl-CoA synthetase (AMP-forming)/AMP-acid ligase II
MSDAINRRIAYDCLTLGRLPERNGRYRADHLAVVAPAGGEARLTCREFDAFVNRTTNVLASLGVTRGDRVATLLPNSLDLVAMFWSCAKLGAAFVPLSPLLNASGIAALVGDANPCLIVVPSDRVGIAESLGDRGRPALLLAGATGQRSNSTHPQLDALRSAASSSAVVADVSGDDLMTIMYTSGTTGLPKGIEHTHFIRAMYATLMANAWRMTPESVVLHCGSLVFNGAMVTMLPAFMLGATFVLHAAFDAAAFIAAVERERVTHTMLVPSQIVAILDAPTFDASRLGSLEMLVSLGAPLHREQRARLAEALPGRVYELYGLTEGFVTILDRADVSRKPGSVGVPPPFYDLRIVDEDGNDVRQGQVGEIVGRGPITMAGYSGREHETRAALRGGWLHSGDLGYLDADGFLYLVDRKKDMIDSGGVKVYPRDIEEVAARHPAVHEVAVFGVPHSRWGETPLAAIVLKKNATVSAETLRAWINANVAAQYQRVDQVVIYVDFPRNAAGKTMKREMRASYREGRDTKI